ncbi:MAG: SDR family NAD(P)-dependent oxidoreductase [Pseudomonadota bacterium]
MGHLKGKTIIVTGGAGGIGSAISLELGRQGANVVVNDVGASLKGEGQDLSTAEALVEQIRAEGGSAVVDAHSIADWDEAQAIVQTAIDAFGGLHGVVNNAGILRDRYFHNMDPAEWRAVIDVNLSGYFYVSRAAAPVFREQGSGSLVHFTSTAGLIGTTGQVNYGAAKAGIVGLSKQIALDMERFGVRSNCVAPFAWTRMTSNIPSDTPEQAERVRKLSQMSPEKVAPLVAFLLSDEAKEVNAQIFAVRNNEIFLMGQSRPLRSIHRGEGWSVDALAEYLVPTLRNSFYGLEQSRDVFPSDPV